MGISEINRHWHAWLTKIGQRRRQIYLNKKRSQLRNTTPSIIANNCVGGMVYHDLGLKFYSPTIDLLLGPTDFMKFVNRLEEYLQCEPEETFDDRFHYPLGKLNLKDESVLLRFMHYKTFEEAREKWIERSKRVNLDNIYIIFHLQGYIKPWSKVYYQFRKLPYPNKVMLTFPIGIFDCNVVPYFSRRLKNTAGLMLKYPHSYSKKRYIDRCNFVKFLNRGYNPPERSQPDMHL